MQIIYLSSPRMLSADLDLSWSMPEFFLLCQMFFSPLIVLPMLDWSLTAHIRHLTHRH
jgi:hypothetical protein